MVILDFSDGDFLLLFFVAGISGSKRSEMMSQGLAGDEEEDDVVEQEEESVNDGERRHQTRPLVLLRLLLALAGMGVLKQGSGGETEPSSSTSCSSEVAISLDDFMGEGKGAENPEKESSTKWDSHSRSSKSSAGTVSSLVGKEGKSETMES